MNFESAQWPIINSETYWSASAKGLRMSCTETIGAQSSSTDDGCSSRSDGSPIEHKPAAIWHMNTLNQLSPATGDEQTATNVIEGSGLMEKSVLPPTPSSTAVNDQQLTAATVVAGGDAEGVWSADIDQAFLEALQIYPPCGRRKIILSDEGKMYGRNELIARYIKIRCGKTRTRKQVSSHIQVLARKKSRELQSKFKHGVQDQASKDKALQQLQSLSSAQIVSMSMAQQQQQQQQQQHEQEQKQQALDSAGQQQSNGPSLVNGLTATSQPNFYASASSFWPQSSANTSLTTSSMTSPSSMPSSAIAIVAAAAAAACVNPFAAHADVKFPCARLPTVTSPAASAFISPHFSPLNGLTSPQSLMSPMISSRLSLVEQQEEGEGSISSSKLTLSGFTAYVQSSEEGPRVDLIKIPRYVDEPLETIKMEHIVEKYPDVLRLLFDKGPKDMFFLVKCWANISFQLPDDRSALYAVDSFYDSSHSLAINVSTKVCSFGKQVVEKVEVDTAEYERRDRRYHFRSERSPMCDYMVKFIAELKKLNNEALMNSVLENFTVLQVVTSKESRETLMVIAFMFEVSPEPESTCRVYRLVDDNIPSK